MHIVTAEALICVLPPPFESLFRRSAGDEAVAAVADQVRAFGLAEGVADLKVVFGFKELHQRPLELAIL
jgi:hypothetical protein